MIKKILFSLFICIFLVNNYISVMIIGIVTIILNLKLKKKYEKNKVEETSH